MTGEQGGGSNEESLGLSDDKPEDLDSLHNGNNLMVSIGEHNIVTESQS
ncbi:hypothetical protein [Dyadobacter sp. 50-39]|nr:hypothetical protein [Dyadobacter sp. 50-39]